MARDSTGEAGGRLHIDLRTLRQGNNRTGSILQRALPEAFNMSLPIAVAPAYFSSHSSRVSSRVISKSDAFSGSGRGKSAELIAVAQAYLDR